MTITCTVIINSLGLILDILGGLLLLRYGLPPKIDPEGHIYLITRQVDETEITTAKRYHKWSRLGIILLTIGFFLQFISNFV